MFGLSQLLSLFLVLLSLSLFSILFQLLAILLLLLSQLLGLFFLLLLLQLFLSLLLTLTLQFLQPLYLVIFEVLVVFNFINLCILVASIGLFYRNIDIQACVVLPVCVLLTFDKGGLQVAT